MGVDTFYRHLNASHRLQQAFAEKDEAAIQEGIRNWESEFLGSPLSVFLGNPVETKEMLERGRAVIPADISLFFNWFHLSRETQTLAGGLDTWALWMPQIIQSPLLRDHCLQSWARAASSAQELWSALKLESVLQAHRDAPLFKVKTKTFSLLVDPDPLRSPEVAVLQLNLLQLAWVHMNFEACQVLLSQSPGQAGMGLADSCWPHWTLKNALALSPCWTEGLSPKHKDDAGRLLAGMAEEDIFTMDSYQALNHWLLAQQLERAWKAPASNPPGLRL